MKKSILIVCIAVVIGLGSAAMAVDIETVHVGNPGNADDTRGTGYGAVDYEYNIGKYEVTAGQYCEFLNAVAKTDTYGLYNSSMWSNTYGCKIQQSGGSGSYTYSVPDPQRLNRPVNYISWYDTLRFANWLTNGQPSEPQGNGTTETGSYTLTGATSVAPLPDHATLAAETTTKWLLTSEDEWYKAAYYKGGGTNAGYWLYPTQSDTAPTGELPAGTDMTNGSANVFDYYSSGYRDTTYYTTEVGAYDAKPSDSPYGTFDQCGNVWEWNESLINGSERVALGGSFSFGDEVLMAATQYWGAPAYEDVDIGFRVSEVPEPATLTMLALGGLALVRRRKRGMCK